MLFMFTSIHFILNLDLHIKGRKLNLFQNPENTLLYKVIKKTNPIINDRINILKVLFTLFNESF